MPVQMIELEDAQMIETSDDALETVAKVPKAGVYTKLVNTANVC